MSDVTTWYAVAALGITTVGGLATKYVGRGRTQEVQVTEVPESMAGADLSTNAGIVAMLVQVSQEVADLRTQLTHTQARVSAQGRYQRLLESTIQTMGGIIPRPDPEDEPLIRS